MVIRCLVTDQYRWYRLHHPTVRRRRQLKITAIKSFPFQSEYGRSYYVVKVETDEGIYGLGEVGMAFWGRLSRRPWTISRR